MMRHPHSAPPARYIVLCAALAATSFAQYAAAQGVSQLVYVALPQPCRIVESRTAYNTSFSAGMLQPKTAYTYGVDDTSIRIQTGNNSASCGIDASAAAVATSILILDATDVGDVRAWANTTLTPPASSIAVFNAAIDGAAFFNGAFTNIAVNGQQFNIRIDHASVNLVIDVQGYWRAVSWSAKAPGQYAVALGVSTTASGTSSTAMGYNSHAAGQYSTAIGYGPVASGDFSLATGSSSNASGLAATAMGNGTTASAMYAAAFGQNTTASAFASFAAGYSTAADGSASFASGNGSVAGGSNSTAVGYGVKATGTESVAMGNATTASGASSTALGAYTTASGLVSTALGYYTTADGVASTALGYAAITSGHNYSFVYGDGSATTANTADNQFMVRASGGFVFYTSTNGVGVGLAAGSGSWSSSSDRNAKNQVQPVDSRDVLSRVVAMPLSTWHYKAQDTRYRHLGPMAQDFYAAFRLGENDTSIDNVDADGVALAAIQGLNAMVDEKDAEIKALRTQLAQQALRREEQFAALRIQLDSQTSRLTALEHGARDATSQRTTFSVTDATIVAQQP